MARGRQRKLGRLVTGLEKAEGGDEQGAAVVEAHIEGPDWR